MLSRSNPGMKTLWTLALCCAIGLFLGCNPEDGNGESNNNGTDNHEHDHDHGENGHDDGHEHGHEHGPNNGELFTFEPADFRGEIAKSGGDENQITIYLLYPNSDKEYPVKADKIIVNHTQGREPQTFELMAQNADDEGMAHEFSVSDQTIVMAYKAFGFEAELEVDGKKYTAKIAKDPH